MQLRAEDAFPADRESGTGFVPMIAAPARHPLAERLRRMTLNKIARHVGRALVPCANEWDMDEMVDSLVTEPGYRLLHDSLCSLNTLEMQRQVASSSQPPDDFVHLAGWENRDLMTIAGRLTSACASAALQIAGQLAQSKVNISLPRTAGPLWFLEEASLPLAIKSALLAREHAEVYAIALYGRKDTELPTWQLRPLAQRLVTELKTFLAFLAGVKGVQIVDADLLPPTARLNFAQATEDHGAAERAFQQRLRQARHTSAEQYPAAVELDDEQ